jgi:hypothetical protein
MAGNAKNIAIHRGEAMELEIARIFCDNLVDLLVVLHPTLEQFIAETPATRAETTHFVEFFKGLIALIALHFPLVKILHRCFAGIASDSHG